MLARLVHGEKLMEYLTKRDDRREARNAAKAIKKVEEAKQAKQAKHALATGGQETMKVQGEVCGMPE
jgi:FlaA1/EpsC-like NDP-sugar epimerase